MRWIVGILVGVLATAFVACAGSAMTPADSTQNRPPSENATVSPKAGEQGNNTSSNDSKSERVNTGDLPAEPSGAVGFHFGDDATQAESTCTQAGFAWRKVGGEAHHCGGLPESSQWKGSVFVQFCGGQVCLLRTAVDPPDPSDSAWLSFYDKVVQTLSEQYGEPTQRTHTLPARCTQELAKCLEKGEAVLRAKWQWPNGEYVELHMPPPTKGRKVSMRITYSTAEGGS